MNPRVDQMDADEPPNDITAFLDAVIDRIERDIALLEEIAAVIRRRRSLPTLKAPASLMTARTADTATRPLITKRTLILEALAHGPMGLSELMAHVRRHGYAKEAGDLRTAISALVHQPQSPVVRLSRGVYALKGDA